MQAPLDELLPYQDAHTLALAAEAALVPIIALEFGTGPGRISLFSVIATFGTAQDITADELRIESVFPADETTEQLLRAAAD